MEQNIFTLAQSLPKISNIQCLKMFMCDRNQFSKNAQSFFYETKLAIRRKNSNPRISSEENWFNWKIYYIVMNYDN
jgi:hypothetical protein